MTQQIAKENWNEFFKNLSNEMRDWETTVQVLDGENGAQTLSEGLPFEGLTFESKNGEEKIELTTGTGTDSHQTHNIFQPKSVSYDVTGENNTGVLDIEDEKGTKTLIEFSQPFPAVITYTETAIVSISE